MTLPADQLERVKAAQAYAREKALIQARHEGDPAYEDTHESPARLRLREEMDRQTDRDGF